MKRVALSVAQLVAADQAGGAVAVGSDAIAGEHPANLSLPRIRRATSCAGAGLAVAWQINGLAAPGASAVGRWVSCACARRCSCAAEGRQQRKAGAWGHPGALGPGEPGGVRGVTGVALAH
jgi:hypothetical protein